jgi:hypothetical protein
MSGPGEEATVHGLVEVMASMEKLNEGCDRLARACAALR